MSQGHSDSSGQPVDLDQKLEAEIEAALGDMSVEDMLDLEDKAKAPPARGGGGGEGREMRKGLIVSVDEKDVLVEFGPKSQGLCPLDQFKADTPEVGKTMEFVIDRFDQNQGLFMLSREGAVRKAEWESLEVGQVIECRCVGVVKGGLEVAVGSHKGFMPAGQVDLHFVKDVSVLLNEKIAVEIITLDRRRGRIVVSRRKVLAVERERRREELMAGLQVGKKITATVVSLQPYGAFADIGGMEGLIHISDMSYTRLKHPSELLKEGQQVEVEILKIEESKDDRDRGPRIGLGLKQCMSDPFKEKTDEMHEGDSVSGKITRIAAFGAFMEIAPGVEGLIHISQLAHERVNRVSAVVKEGEVVTAKILSIDPSARRISLSLKALKEGPENTGGDGDFQRKEDPHMRKLKAQLSAKFGDHLKGGIG